MDKIIPLFQFSENLNYVSDSICCCVSPNLTHLNIVNKNEESFLYLLSSEFCPELLWECKGVLRCMFCEDENYILYIFKSGVVQIVSFNDGVVTLERRNIFQIPELPRKCITDCSETARATLIKFCRSCVVIFLNNLWLLTLKLSADNTLLLISSLEVMGCVSAAVSRENIYFLKRNGNILMYSLDDGLQIGFINLDSVIPWSLEIREFFLNLSVSTDDSYFAVATSSELIFIGSIQETFYFRIRKNGDWDGSESITAGSLTSLVSARTTSSLLKLDNSTLQSVKPDKHKISSWDSYLSSVQSKMSEIQNCHACASLVSIKDNNIGFSLKDFHVSSSGVRVWYAQNNVRTDGIYRLYKPSTGEIILEYHLLPDTVVVWALADIFLSPSSLCLFLGDCSREKLGSKLLYCMDTRTVSHLLQGDDVGDAVIPATILTDGFRHKQLDIVKYALCFHAQSFKHTVSSIQKCEEMFNTKVARIITNLEHVFDVIIKALQDISEFCIYQEQLVSLVLEHFSVLLQCLHDLESNTKTMSVRRCIMMYATDIRTFLYHDIRRSNSRIIDLHQPLSELSDPFKHLWNKWHTMNDIEIVRDAIIEDSIPLAQTFLVTCRQWISDDSFEHMSSEILCFVLDLLSQQQITKAVEVFINFGLNAEVELKRICLQSLDSNIRNSLQLYLFNSGLLETKDSEALKLLRKLESIFEGSNWEKRSFTDITKRSHHSILPLIEQPATSKDSGRLAVCMIKNHPQIWHEQVITEVCSNIFVDENLLEVFDPPSVWNYLLRRNCEKYLLLWIDSFFGKTTINEKKTENFDFLKVIRYSNITQYMVDMIPAVCYIKHMQDLTLDHLCRYGVFTLKEMQNICSIILRFARAESLSNIKEILELSSSNLMFSEYENLLLLFSIKHELFQIPFSCLNICKLREGPNTLANLDYKSWYNLLQFFQSLETCVINKEACYSVVFNSCLYLSNTDAKTYFEENSIVYIAAMLYQYDSLLSFKLSQNCESAYSYASENFPLLKTASSSKGFLRKYPDVTPYELMKNLSLFDIAKLFSWQETELNFPDEMPHCSYEKLVLKFGHLDTLGHLHYVKQARPCFAAIMYFVEKIKQQGKLSGKFSKEASNFAHGLALQNCDNHSITATCCAFTEFLGISSQHLRLHVTVANRILEYLMICGCPSDQVFLLMHGLAKKKETAFEVLKLLEAALLHNLDDLKIDIGTILCKYYIAVEFSKLHFLTLPEEFLKICARQNMWLHFVLFVEFYHYPLHHVLEIVKEFTFYEFSEHLFNASIMCILAQRDDSEKKTHNKVFISDFRKNLYSKIHPDQSFSPAVELNSGDGSSSSNQSTTSQESSCSSESLHFKMLPQYFPSENETEGLNFFHTEDIFLSLIKCNNSQDPPQSLLASCYNNNNSVFAVFAATYEPSSALSCLCTWLDIFLGKTQPESFLRSVKELEDLMVESITKGYLVPLALGWKIFMPESPLGEFFDFLISCVIMKQFKKGIIHLKSFKAACFNLKHSTNIDMLLGNLESCYLSSDNWNMKMAVNLISSALCFGFTSIYYQRIFLQTLCESSFSDHVQVTVPDYQHLFSLADILSGTYVSIDWTSIIDKKTDERNIALQQALDLLILKQNFSCALALAQLGNFPLDSVVLSEWLYNFSYLMRTNEVSTSDFDSFIAESVSAFKEYNISAVMIAKFFKQCTDNSKSFELKCKMLHVAVSWLSDCSDEFKTLRDLFELEIWKYRLSSEEKFQISVVPNSLSSCDSEVLLTKLKTSVHMMLSNEELIRVDTFINNLLDGEDIVSACHVCGLFKHITKDVELLLTCLRLAEGHIKPEDIPMAHKTLLMKVKLINRSSYSHKTFNPGQISSVSSLKYEEEQQDVLTVIEILIEHMNHGKSLGYKIVSCLRAGAKLNKTFKEILSTKDPIYHLHLDSLNDDINRYAVARELLMAGLISNGDLTTYFCKEIVWEETYKGTPYKIWGFDLDNRLNLMIELCEDPSIFGNKLLLAIQNVVVDSQFRLFQEVVELIVYAHCCYTAACNMEGIVEILHRSQILSKILIYHEEWGLLVRLLTGVGRYTEMTYIFHMLKANGQFEMLLAEGLEKILGLKTAVLEYLEKYHSEDKSTWCIAALYFKLYGKVGRYIMNDAKIKLGKFSSKVDSTDENKEILRTVMTDLSQAAEYFVQASKLSEAITTAHLGELVALQLSLINSVPNGQNTVSVLHLSPNEVTDIINNHLSFPQACILARAYSHPVDWGAALYQHCVLFKDANYLIDFTHNLMLTSELIEDVARRFQREANISRDMTMQMKMFVNSISDVLIKYHIASQLGFKDIIESLLNTSALPYLKDTVWCSGYKKY